jgi:chromosomal replication initiation ATPase DnaA
MTARKPKVLLRKQDRIDYVLNGVCDYYSVPISDIMRDAKTTERAKRKRIAIKILRDIADCTLKDMKFLWNHTNESTIFQQYRNIEDELNSGRDFNREIKQEYKEILQYLEI